MTKLGRRKIAEIRRVIVWMNYRALNPNVQGFSTCFSHRPNTRALNGMAALLCLLHRQVSADIRWLSTYEE